MTQCNPHPTREGNILDLVCVTGLDLVKSVTPYPGMSDHEILITEVDITAKLTKKKPRTVLMYKSGTMEDLKTIYEEEILPFKDEMSVESMWKIFTEKLQNSTSSVRYTKNIKCITMPEEQVKSQPGESSET